MKTPAIIRNLLLAIPEGFVFTSQKSDGKDDGFAYESIDAINSIIINKGVVVSVYVIAHAVVCSGLPVPE